MTSPIVKYSHKNKHVVEWPSMGPVKTITSRIKLLELIFNEAKAFEAGLMIQLQGSQCDILWLDFTAFAQDANSYYSDYLQDMYIIRGVVFTEQKCADMFYDILDKKLMWRILSGSTV